MIALCVAAGANRPIHVIQSKSSPDSDTVGTSGRGGFLLRLVTARGRSFPARSCAITGTEVTTIIGTSPETAPAIDGPLPL
jgi:hypothetical protein